MTDARTLTAALGGRWAGGKGTACCPAHEDRNPSLSLADGPDGKLLLHCFRGCTFADITGAAGISGTDWKPDAEAAARSAADEAADRAHRIQKARDIWRAAMPITGTLAEMYLRRRGVTIPLPPTLRYSPECYHGQKRQRLPALIAAVTAGRKVQAIQRIYLTPDGRKITGSDAKMTLGPARGLAVHLAPVDGDHLCIGEGVETCMSAMQLGLGPAWACLGTSGLKAVEVPPEVRRITILADADPAGRDAAREVQRRLALTGRTAIIAEPIPGGDFNDLCRGAA